MNRYFIKLSYNGANYCGWQIQPNAKSVQGELEHCFSTLLREKIAVTGCGRTDTGVHARNYIAHIDSETKDLHTNKQFLYKINKFLHQDIVIHSIHSVDGDAHARFGATAREYKYYIRNIKDPFNREFTCYYYGDLDIDKMNEACKLLFNYKDFTSFSKLHTDVKTNLCNIYKAEWQIEEGIYVFTISANRFLRNMVRAIVGTLLEVGSGKMTLEQFCEVIEMKDRGSAGKSVDAKGLFLTKIEYPFDF